MTNQDIYALLMDIDNGYIPTDIEYQELEAVREIEWEYVDRLPKSIVLLENVTALSLRHCRGVIDVSVLSDLTDLTVLDLHGTRVIDISNLSSMKGLTSLGLHDTNVSDISDLASLDNLTNIDLSWNSNLIDISALSNLESLTRIDLSWNSSLTDISALSNLKRLTNLYLNGTNVSDINALSKLKRLRKLELSECRRIVEINALSELKSLAILDLNCCENLSDISAISALKRISNLDLSRTNINNISALSELKTLKYLYLNGTNVSDIRELSELSSLTTLDLANTCVSDTSALSGLKTLTILNLAGTNVNDISDLSGLINLTNLDLRMTNINDVSALSGLINLTNLDLRRTNINDVSALSRLEALINLDLHYTKVSDISALSELKRLERLDLSGTMISDISVLSGLNALTFLDLSGGEFRQSNLCNISPLSELVNLKKLSLRNTSVSSISVLSKLRDLTKLDLGKTNISILPDWIGRLTHLKELWLSNLTLTELPECLLSLNLEYLDASEKNRLRNGIFIDGLKLHRQPVSLFYQSRFLIKRYYSKKKTALNEAKVIFIGDGGAGKSYTIQRILNNGELLKKDTNITHDIEIGHWENRNRVVDYTGKIDFWDFGGQDIYLSMHKCFLTERSCYVIVISNRQRNSQQDLMRQARYWLNNISAFVGDSPILIAVNTWTGLSKEGVSVRQLQKEFPGLTIYDQVLYNARDRSKKQFIEILERICDMARAAYSYDMMFPTSWLSIRNEITEKYQRCDYISEKEYFSIAEEYMRIFDGYYSKQTARWLLNWFNDLGNCFSYGVIDEENDSKEEYQVLNPKWVIRAMYALVNYNLSGKASVAIPKTEGVPIWENGCMPYRQAVMILNKAGYSEEKREIKFILKILRKMRLSYPIGLTREKYEFIPALCRRQVDEYEKALSDKGYIRHIHYMLQFSFLPDMLLQRLMIRSYETGLPPYSVWESGVRIDFFGERYKISGVTVVITQTNHQILQIETFAVKNQPTSDEFSTVRTWITEIYDSFAMKPEEEYLLACKGKQEAHIPLSSLLKARLEKGLSEFYCHDGGEYECYVIDELLDGLYGQSGISQVQTRNLKPRTEIITPETISRHITQEHTYVLPEDSEIIDGVIMHLRSALMKIHNRVPDFKTLKEPQLTADIQERIDDILNYKYGLQISREYTLGHASKKLGEADLFFYRYENGIFKPFFILENKNLEQFGKKQYKQLIGYLNQDYKCGITICINRKKTWQEAVGFIIEELRKMDGAFSPVNIISYEEDGLVRYIRSEHIMDGVGTIMPIYHLILNLNDRDRQDIAEKARS